VATATTARTLTCSMRCTGSGCSPTHESTAQDRALVVRDKIARGISIHRIHILLLLLRRRPGKRVAEAGIWPYIHQSSAPFHELSSRPIITTAQQQKHQLPSTAGSYNPNHANRMYAQVARSATPMPCRLLV
jgi:hypothetical protein